MSVWDGASGEEDHRPGSRSWLDGRVLTCDGYDDSIRWRPGERLEHLFEQRCDWLRRQGQAGHLAVDAAGGSLSYPELDARANQLARFLIRQGVQPGDRVGLLSDVAVDGYVGMLAVLKAHAAFVPLDASFPADRVAYIASDARVRLILTRSHLAARLGPPAGQVQLVCVDEAEDLIDAERRDPFAPGRGAGAARRACLHHLHVRLDRQAQGRGGRPREHLQLRPGSRRSLRDHPRRPGVPGDDDRVRLLRRGDLGPVDVLRHARPQAGRRQACSARTSARSSGSAR